MVGYDPDVFSKRFQMGQHNTAVTKNMIIIRMADELITIIADETTFAFYRRFFTLDNFSVSIDIILGILAELRAATLLILKFASEAQCSKYRPNNRYT